MPTTTPTGIVALDNYSGDCLALKLTQRHGLPRAENNKPMAPSDDYARHVLKDMATGKSMEYRRLIATDICNLRDGVPAPVVKLPYQRMLGIIDVESNVYRPRSIVALNRRETREECHVNLAQLRIGPDNENDLEALKLLENSLVNYMVIAEEMVYETQRRIALIESGATPRFDLPDGSPTGKHLWRVK